MYVCTRVDIFRIVYHNSFGINGNGKIVLSEFIQSGCLKTHTTKACMIRELDDVPL